ncbi:MAG: iron-containing alcohol dehydrogenase [Bacteroides sp.]|nr:iron-containing alcohol dehydrogenase [Prevotella sp.]MCM1408411.1 iron-containing alcohol dehydrogenase [Treponema brennaborense]MCM1469427.1 iron-containing alcohol dehydrogenase [Bacteroides sp.]
MADFIFKISPNIVLGSYTVARLGQFVREWGSRFMLVLDPVLKDFDIAAKIQNSLADHKIDFFVFDDIPSAPGSEVIKRALKLARDAHIHGVIAAGGTKAAIVARGVCALFNESHDIYEFLDGANPVSSPLPMICVPTTMRDAFLFTDRALIPDDRGRQLKLLKVQPGLCKLALFDPNLTVSLTSSQTAGLSLQILCIAVEAYLSQKSNFFSDIILEKAMELISGVAESAQQLNPACPSEILLAQSGCMASLGAGLSSVGPATLLAMVISAKFKLPRAVITSILFPYLIEEASSYKSEKLARVAAITKIADSTVPAAEAVSTFADTIRNRIALANLPARLKDLSVSIEQLALAVENAGQLDLMNGMPRSMTSDDLFELLKQAY